MVTVTYCQKTEAFDFKVPIGADEALSSYIRDEKMFHINFSTRPNLYLEKFDRKLQSLLIV